MAKKKKYFIWIIIIAIVVGGFFYLRSRKSRTTYTTQEVKRGDLKQTVSVTGKLVSPETISLSFQTGGEIDKIFVEIGDQVKVGQKIASLNTESLTRELRAAQEDVVYQQRILDDMRRNKNTYGGKKREAQAALIKKAKELEKVAQKNLREATIFSSVEGVVITRNKDAGEITSIGEEIVSVAGKGELEIHSNVSESDIVKVKLGQKAQVKFDALPVDEILEAEVFFIDPAATVIQDVVYFRVKLKLEKSDERLKVGMSNDVDIATAFRGNVLIVPLRAVKNGGPEKHVEVLRDEKNNVVENVTVTTGLEGDEGMVEILSGNLKERDKVITLVSKAS